MTLMESTGLQVANELAKSALRLLATDADYRLVVTRESAELVEVNQ